MYSLHLTCTPEQVDELTGTLWEAGTAGIRELEQADGSVELIAGFESTSPREALLHSLRNFAPQWRAESDTDWVTETYRAWPGRKVGDRLFLAAPWCEESTPAGRIRLIHNPGLACGTGEHPCTRLVLTALELVLKPEQSVFDIGTGSAILAIAALKLGARMAVGVDPDEAALPAARENFALNNLCPTLAAGSADCLAAECADVVMANISPSVLLALADELLRLPRPQGTLILSGFLESEAHAIAQVFPPSAQLTEDGWDCIISTASSRWPF
jgi:ribosomal protein L11 methyltransferase